MRLSVPMLLAALSALFSACALRRLARNGWCIDPASRTWLIVAAVFAAVSAWLALQ